SSSSIRPDPLADPAICRRDIPHLVALQTNLLHVYAINGSNDHSECFRLLDEAGIYVMSDLIIPDEYGSGSETIGNEGGVPGGGGLRPAWDVDMLRELQRTIDAVSVYDNFLGFAVGSGASRMRPTVGGTEMFAFVRAAVRDAKAYIGERGYRDIPIGYSTYYDFEIPADGTSYLTCGDPLSSVDFIGITPPSSWCGTGPVQVNANSGLDVNFPANFVPVFMSEYRCSTSANFSDVRALSGEEMTKVWSGGTLWQYYDDLATSESSGLVDIENDVAVPNPTFTALASVMSSLQTPALQDPLGPQPTAPPRACPTVDATWQASTNLPPTPDTALCDCAMDSFACVGTPDPNGDKYFAAKSLVCEPDTGMCPTFFSGVGVNGSSGVYGPYSTCNSTVKLSYAFNMMYQSTPPGVPATCGMASTGILRTPSPLSQTCRTLLLTSPSPSPPPSSPPTSDPLTTAAKIGIAVGAAAGVIVLLSVLTIAILRRRRRGRRGEEERAELEAPKGLFEAPGQNEKKVELFGRTEDPPWELEDTGVAVELEGSLRR
ncbi:carbohydrate-binding module family 43 protein, partial [Aulographum hederae CBS 113979]